MLTMTIPLSARHWQAAMSCLRVNAPEKVFVVGLDAQVIKSVPIKGLVGQEMTWEQYVTLMKEQARSEERRLLDKQHRVRQLSLSHLKAPEGVIQM
jgi:hypothetical protein